MRLCAWSFLADRRVRADLSGDLTCEPPCRSSPVGIASTRAGFPSPATSGRHECHATSEYDQPICLKCGLTD